MIDMITRSFNNRNWFSQHIPAIVTKIPAKVDTIPARDQKQEHDKVRTLMWHRLSRNFSIRNNETMQIKTPFHAPDTTNRRSNHAGTGGLSSK
jgi:hypothetical protein